jgi:hypothetical protein
VRNEVIWKSPHDRSIFGTLSSAGKQLNGSGFYCKLRARRLHISIKILNLAWIELALLEASRFFFLTPCFMNFIEISPGVFIGTHMITRFEIALIENTSQKCLLYIWFIGDGEEPGVEVFVKDQNEALEKLGMKAVSNLNLVKP